LAVEHQSEIFVELRPVSGEAGPQSVEYIQREALGIGRGLQHDRWDGGDQDGLCNASRAMPSDVACDFSAARGMTYDRDFVQIESLDHGRQIVGIPVHVVAG
jgi:hypothetical protein